LKQGSGAAITVLLVDDHAVVREGYRRLLESAPGVTVVGEAANSLEALHRDRELTSDVVVLDIALPGASGIETLRRIRARRPEAHVLMFSMYHDAVYALRALEAGATGYVSKSTAPELLIEAVRAVAGGRQYISPDVHRAMTAHSACIAEIHESLSAREHEVLRLLLRGEEVGDIGEKLGISPKTVANLQTSIKHKLGAGTALQLLVIARRLGLSA
jgi:two-component system, NarL family, invasion response regulator UvrY